ncbi:Alpha/Beta hydrolase protein [Phycomyces nitens]|nr:Alpha/Beta hydrolase protein [Phycomyces nitens]
MSILWSIRSWIATSLLRVAFTIPSTHNARLIIHVLAKLFFGYDSAWVKTEEHGFWVGKDIRDMKREELDDRLENSARVVFWVPGGGFRFNLGQLYVPTFINWLTGLDDKGMPSTFFVAKYRHGPHHLFADVIQDLTQAYDWLVYTMNVPASKIVLGADDAGVAALLDTLLSCTQPEDRPEGIVCVSPYTGLEAGGKSWQNNASYDYIRPVALARMEDSYLVPEDIPQANADTAFKLFTTTLSLASALPRRMLILVGGHEVLLDDAGLLAEKARKHGLQVTLVQIPEQVHLWALLGKVVTKDPKVIQKTTDQFVEFVGYSRKS